MLYKDPEGRALYVRTFTGKKINLLALNPHDIDVRDIAHHLSLQNRFAGATERAYCTAQHSIHVMQVAEWIAPASMTTERRLQALLHDAEEAYTGDIITPIKHDPRGAGIRELGNRLRCDIFEILGLARTLPDFIKEADLMVAAWEIRDVMGEDPEEWGFRPPLKQNKIIPWGAPMAEQRFQAEYNRLANVLECERAPGYLSTYGFGHRL